jgi:hypothetical protein
MTLGGDGDRAVPKTMSAETYGHGQSTTTKEPPAGQATSKSQLVFIPHSTTGNLDAKDRKIVRRRLLTLNRRKKTSKIPQLPGDSNQASLRKRNSGTERGLDCDKDVIDPLIIVYSTPDTELGHEALIEYQAKQPLLDRLGNIITDPLGILEAVSCPGILTYDAFCHWYSLTDVTVAKRSVHFENAAYFWGEALWDVSCRDEALFAALLSLVARKRAEFLGAQDSHRHVQASEHMSLTRLRQHISTNPINGSTLVSIAGLAMMGALHYDRASVHLHMGAVQRLWPSVRSDENEWLFIVFIDLGIVSCTGQRPYIPHDLHPQWAVRVVPLLPIEDREASRLALHDTLSFGKVFGQHPGDLFAIFKALHELRLMWNGSRRDQYPPFATLYTLVHQTCVHHASVLDHANCTSPLGDLGAIAIKLCAWEWAAPFVSSKRGIHELLLKRALAILPKPSQDLISLWQQRAAIQSLLWVLFAITSECCRSCPDDLHHWAEVLRMVCDRMNLVTIDDLCRSLDDFPAANWWRVDALPRFYSLIRPLEVYHTPQAPAGQSEQTRTSIPRRRRFPSTSPFLNFQDGY